MTRIHEKRITRPVWHETHTVTKPPKPGIICVAETPSNLLLRLKGRRAVLKLPWESAFDKAIMLAVRDAALAKINRKRRARSIRRGIFA